MATPDGMKVMDERFGRERRARAATRVASRRRARSRAPLPLLLTLLVFATHASASDFGDCFQRLDLACRQQVAISYGCTAEGQPPGLPNACKGHWNEAVIVRGKVVNCGGGCTAPRSAFDQCVSAAATHCAALLDGSQAKGQP